MSSGLHLQEFLQSTLNISTNRGIELGERGIPRIALPYEMSIGRQAWTIVALVTSWSAATKLPEKRLSSRAACVRSFNKQWTLLEFCLICLLGAGPFLAARLRGGIRRK